MLKVGDEIEYLGGPSNDDSVIEDDPRLIGLRGRIVRPGDFGWEWVIDLPEDPVKGNRGDALGDAEMYADSKQLRGVTH